MIHVEVDPAVDCAVQCHLRKLIAECPTHFSPLTTAHGAKAFLVANFRDCLSCSRILLLIVSWCHLKEVDSRSVPVHQSRSQHYPAPTNLVSHSSKSSQNSFLLVISRDPIWIMLRCSPCSGIRLKLTAECQSQAIPFPPSFFLSDFSFYIFFPCPTSFLSR